MQHIMHAQDSCACTTLLCMHNTLVHAQEPGLGPKTVRSRALDRPSCLVPVSGPWLGPWPLGSLAQCMHKSVVHAKECCACTRILCMHKNLDILTTRLAKALKRPAKALQRLAKSYDPMSYKPVNIQFILENPAMTKCQKILKTNACTIICLPYYR